MKIIMDFKEKPVKNDIIIFDGENFNVIRKNQFLNDIITRVINSESEIEKIYAILKQIDDKLEKHHNILKELTKGE